MRTKILLVIVFISFMFAISCDSESTKKYLNFSTDMLLPQAPIGLAYDFTFTVTYGEDKWNADTGFVDSEIIWSFENWKVNNLEQTEGPTNLTFADGQITGTPDDSECGLWSFDVTIEKGKTIQIERFYLAIAQNVEIMTQAELPIAVTDTAYSTYLSARYGSSPYFWSYENWAKDGNSVNDPPVGLTCNSTGYISGSIDHSEAGKWTFDAKVFDSSIPKQLIATKNFELEIKLKIEVPTNYPTIQAAVDIAEDGEIVYLADGTFQGAGNRDVKFNGKTLTILGNPQDPGAVIIDCEGSFADPHRAFYFASEETDCVIDGLTIMKGCASSISSYHRGGAIYCEDNIGLTVQNCIIKEIHTESQVDYIYGSAIYVQSNSELKVLNTLFKDNKSTLTSNDSLYGNTLYVGSSSKATFRDVRITGSVVENGNNYLYGGEFYFTSAEYDFKDVTIDNGQYTHNEYTYIDGGMMYFSSCTGVFENVNIVNNAVIGKRTSYIHQRGSIGEFSSCTSEFINCVIANNSYEFIGTATYTYNYGLFYMNSGTSKWRDCIFSQNEFVHITIPCRYYGGIMYLYSNKAQIDRCHFLMNNYDSTPYTTSTTFYAGGIRTYSSADAVINDCVFAFNKSSMAAGALSNSYSTATMTVNNTTIFKNEGGMGGGIFNYGGTLTVNNSIMWDNVGTTDGNQIYVYSGTATVANSCYSDQSGDIYGTVTPTSCVNTDPFFKDTGDNPVTGDCTFSDVEMTVTGTPGTSAFMSEIMRGDMIYLTSDSDTKALAVVEVVSDTELKVAGYYTGTPGTGAATVKKMDLTPQHTSKGDANDSPCVDAGDNSKSTSTTDILGNTRVVDGNGNSTPTIDMGAYEMQ